MHPTHPRRRPWPTVLLLAVTAVALALLAVVLVAPPVGAHSLGGVEPSNYRARVLAVRPPVPGLTVEVVDAGTRLRLVNTGPRDVVVLGYQSEPWLRVPPGGVVTWHDRRARWEAEQPPAEVRRAPGSAHLVIPEWIVPLRTMQPAMVPTLLTLKSCNTSASPSTVSRSSGLSSPSSAFRTSSTAS